MRYNRMAPKNRLEGENMYNTIYQAIPCLFKSYMRYLTVCLNMTISTCRIRGGQPNARDNASLRQCMSATYSLRLSTFVNRRC
jgi:hypothetical protein